MRRAVAALLAIAMAATLSSGKDIQADEVLFCVGRKPNSAGIGIDGAGIKTENARICVDGGMRTNIPNIYAIGDVVALLDEKVEEATSLMVPWTSGGNLLRSYPTKEELEDKIKNIIF